MRHKTVIGIIIQIAMITAASQLEFLFGRMLGVVAPTTPKRDAKADPAPQRKGQCAVENPALLASAQGGDRSAQAKLVGALQDIWYRYSLSMLRQPDAARDASQETALRFLRELPRFEKRSTLKTWSLSIAINVCRERRRADKKHRAASWNHDRTDSAPGPDLCAAAAEQRDQLLSIIERLSERQREVVTLRFFEQLSVNQTAEAMGCAAGTVKATLSQAIIAMRKLMEVRDDNA